MARIKGIRQAQHKLRNFAASSNDISFLIGLAQDEVASAARLDNQESIQQFITDLEQWCRTVQGSLKAAAPSATVAQSIQPRVVSNRLGEPIRIDISLHRLGFYLHHGASRRYGGLKGSKWTSNGIVRTTDPEALGRAGTGKRPARHFIDTTLNSHLEALATLVANYSAHLSVELLSLS